MDAGMFFLSVILCLSSLRADPNQALCLARLSRGSGCQRQSRLVQGMQHLTFANYLVFFLPPPLSPQQGVFGAQCSNPAMSIIGAEDEDFENDLNDVSSRRVKLDLVAPFVVV